jgi:hypothetical protein
MLPQLHLSWNLDNECFIVFYNLADMHKITPNIHEVIAFTKWLSVKQILRNVLSLKSVLYSHI